jgi:hypothetical protein
MRKQYIKGQWVQCLLSINNNKKALRITGWGLSISTSLADGMLTYADMGWWT